MSQSFQSTLPTRGSDNCSALYFSLCAVFNPRSPRGGATRPPLCRPPQACGFQSTLPTRGSDPCSPRYIGLQGFSIHAPHEGERPCNCSALYFSLCAFQSTLPTRGSDYFNAYFSFNISFFNPRSPRGGATLPQYDLCFTPDIFSIHAPHEGERRRKSAFVCSISANLLNIIHCGTVTRAVSRRRIALFRLFSVRRSGVFMYAYASH